jgi:spore coat polysaccharide biosynthesis protein SpsF
MQDGLLGEMTNKQNYPVIAIVQARMGSSRLPGKVMAEVSGKPVIQYVLDRLRRVPNIDNIVLATSTKKQDNILYDFAVSQNTSTFRGSETDVLSRFLQASVTYNAQTIVRICGEDILLDPNIVEILIDRHLESNVDYTTNIIGRAFPEGLYAEVISKNALQSLANKAISDDHREHVTKYILDNLEKYRVQSIQPYGIFKKSWLDMSVDTHEDLERVRSIAKALFPKGEFISSEVALEFLDRQNK